MRMNAVKDFLADLLDTVKKDPKHFAVVAAFALVVGAVVGKFA
jgi:hypothetical protein